MWRVGFSSSHRSRNPKVLRNFDRDGDGKGINRKLPSQLALHVMKRCVVFGSRNPEKKFITDSESSVVDALFTPRFQRQISKPSLFSTYVRWPAG